MPKKNGKEVYDVIKKAKPDIKVVFVSGYSADIIHKKGIMEILYPKSFSISHAIFCPRSLIVDMPSVSFRTSPGSRPTARFQ